LNNPVTMGLL